MLHLPEEGECEESKTGDFPIAFTCTLCYDDGVHVNTLDTEQKDGYGTRQKAHDRH